VKQLDDLNRLVSFLKTEHIPLANNQILQLEKYLSLLTQFASRHRIVSNTDVNYIVTRHFISSFYFVKEIQKTVSDQDNILDLGSGAGFPGIILSLVFPNRVVLIDSVRKKTIFLQRVVKELGLNCEVINDRIENFAQTQNRYFKIITARALASINELIDLSLPLLEKSELHTIKGLDFRKENRHRENEISLSYHKIDDRWTIFSDYLNQKVYVTFSIAKN
jgi:16S rRNA (guanine527-N7)-methyltransferase